VILDLIGISSILQSADHHGFLDHLTPAADRPTPPKRFVEHACPTRWWRAEYGVNRVAARSLGLL